MKKTSSHEPIFSKNESGELVQTGGTSSFSVQDSSVHSATRDRAVALRGLFQKHNLSIDKSPTLAKLFADTIRRSDAWLAERSDEITYEQIFNAAHMERIASAALNLADADDARPHLQALLTGSLDLLSREQSKAKDTLWELELLGMLRDIGFKVELTEPDLSLVLDGTTIGVACKKFYSEANVWKVISKAISQVERSSDVGIVAINLDDLLPANRILQAPTIASMAGVLERRIEQFMQEHERHLRRYLQPGRAMTALVSCGALADVASGQPRFLNARQCVAWHIPGLPRQQDEKMNMFIETFRVHYEAQG